MKKTKFAYLFATTLVAGTMGLVSCSEEGETPLPVEGENTEVTIGLSVAPSTRATADDVNLGTTKNDIANVAVVPMVDDAYQKPICWTSVGNNGESTAKPAQMLSTVNGFKVYGNLNGTQYDAVQNVWALTNDMFALTTESTLAGYKKPHEQLYYFANAKFEVSSTGGSYAQATGWATAATIGSAKYIKVSDINYAVGVLAAAVMNGDETLCFEVEGEKKNAVDAGVKVSGITIDNQKGFEPVNFTTTETAVDVYEPVATGKEDFGTKMASSADAANGNLFVIVSPTAEEEEVSVNIEFLLPEGVILTKTDGSKVTGAAGGTKLYLGLKMKPAGQATTSNISSVFAADYVTILNATVKNWGIASTSPVDVTDAEIGVVFDVDWEEGNLYDIEI